MLENHELILIGSLILDPTNVDRIDGEVGRLDFVDTTLGECYHALCIAVAAGECIANGALAIDAIRRQRVAIDGGVIGKAISEAQPSYAVYHAKCIRRKSLLRKQSALAATLKAKAEDPNEDPINVSEWFKAQWDSIGSGAGNRVAVCVYDAAIKALNNLEADGLHGPPVFTGLVDVDNMIGGFQPGELIVIAARPGIGKTCLGTQVAMHAAKKGTRALIVSLEMKDTELALRIICAAAGVDSRLIRTRKASNEHLERLRNQAELLSGIECMLWDPPSATVESIRGFALRESCHGLGLLVVDYLQLVRVKHSKYGNRNEEVAHISGSLKRLAREIRAPVLAMCQLNRSGEGEAPKLSHLRESGAIEQDADMVMFIQQDRDGAQLIVGKNRNGDTGAIPVRWIPHETRFADRVVTQMPNYNADLNSFNNREHIDQEAF